MGSNGRNIIEGSELQSVSHSVSQAAIVAYAEASGDFNPIHLDPEFAAASHFGRRVAHGMMIAASVSELMAGTFGLEWARSGRVKLRFRAPVFPGDRIETRGTVRKVEDIGSGRRRVTCKVETVRCDPEAEQVAIAGEASLVVSVGANGQGELIDD